MAYEFLPQLRNIHSTKRHTARTIVDDDFLFVITKVSDGPTLKTVNKALKPIEPDYHFFSGEKAQLLRSLDKIREEKAFEILHCMERDGEIDGEILALFEQSKSWIDK